jgi:hypothetical protein
MREPDNGWTSIPSIQDLCNCYVYGQGHVVPLTLRYFSAPPSRTPSHLLLDACRDKSNKLRSAKKRVTSVVYHKMVEEYDRLDDFKIMASPSLPISEMYFNDFKFTSAIKTKKGDIMEKEEIVQFSVPTVLTTKAARDYFANPLDAKNKDAFICLFPATATSVALKLLENFPVGNIVNFHSDQ